MIRLSDCASGRDNNFNLIRFIAASCVIISHSVLISGGETQIEPLEALTGFTLGDHAVNVFFVISGFLVTKSLVSRSDFALYAASRTLRIVPGLLVVGLVTAFIFGPLATILPFSDYFSSLAVWLYGPTIGSLGPDPLDLTLPGVFATNPFPDMVNGPLWTLRYEVIAYICLAIAVANGVYAGKKRFGIFLALFIVLFVAYSLWVPAAHERTSLDHLMRFGLAFSLGSGFYMLRAHTVLNWRIPIGLLLMTLLLAQSSLYHAALMLFTAYTSLWLAFVPDGAVRRFNRLGDYSYGLYIYGWPVAQLIILALPGLSAPALLALGYTFTLPMAMLSWHLVEKQALTLRFVLAERLRKLWPFRPHQPV